MPKLIVCPLKSPNFPEPDFWGVGHFYGMAVIRPLEIG